MPRMATAMGAIDDAIVADALAWKKKDRPVWHRWGAMAASLALLLAAVLALIPTGTDAPPHIDPDAFFVEGYTYAVNEGSFSAYVGGRVINGDKLGEKITDVTVTAGWKNAAGEWTSAPETLRGEIYGISGIPTDVAVALRFTDQGEAVTTTHYYVIMDPEADLDAVSEYIIPPIHSGTAGEE